MVSSWKYLGTTFFSFYRYDNNVVVQRSVCACQWQFTTVSLTELSPCDSLHSIFKYVPTQGKLVIKSKRNPLFSPVSVYEPLKVPEEGWGKQTIHGIPLLTESLKLGEPNKLISCFLGDSVAKEKNMVCVVLCQVAQS